MTKLTKCYFCPNQVTNQQKLVLVPEKGGSYHVCNLCWYQQRIISNRKIIANLTKQNQDIQQKIVKLSNKKERIFT